MYKICTTLLVITISFYAAAQQAESWQEPYTGEDAQGDHVVGFWNFEESGEKIPDVSGHGHDGTIAGVERNAAGRFGAAITSFCGHPVEDVRHAVAIPNSPALSLSGAFTLEMWIRPAEALTEYGAAYLLDKKYVAHSDYQWILDAPDGLGNRHMRLTLGFGKDSETWWSLERAPFKAGQWYHVAVTYDGAGTVNFIQNGRTLGGATKQGRGSVFPGTKELSLGDRLGSHYGGFPGDIDEVRITKGVCEFRPLTLSVQHHRSVYRRMEPDAVLQFQLNNVSKVAQTNIRIAIDMPGMEPETSVLPVLASGESHALSLNLDTRLRTGDYEVGVSYALGEGETAYRNRETFPVKIVPRELPYRMPVVMWGVGGVENVTESTPELKDIGFTHCLGLRCDFNRIWDAQAPVVPAVNEDQLEKSYAMLDQALADDLGIVITLGNGHWLENKDELLRINQEGTAYERKNICCTLPGIMEFSSHIGESVAQTYGDFPAFDAALINTEVRDSSQVCFHEHDRTAYREATGKEYPEAVRIKNGVQYGDIENFPANRVVPDDHELLQFYKWFWREGDGWNAVNTAMKNGFVNGGREDLWTFFDPAVRVPSLWGSGGRVDYISHWTYTYPDPIRIGLTTDELFAMAAGNDQSVMKMTQIIWYRSQTAPIADAAAPDREQSAWEDYDPDAAYITIAPMHMREAFWTKMARPIKGIMYHGWQSLVPTEGTSAYRYTHPETRNVLKDLVHTVVKPLGPTLLQVPAAKCDVAFLESFTSQMFARRGTYGWGGSWAGDAYHILQYAHLQADIIYEETIQQKGLKEYRVLFLMDCDVLTASMVAAIQAFQQRGGIIVGDERLCPALTADIVIQSYSRVKNAAVDKQELLDRAGTLRTALAPHYTFYLDSSTVEVLPYRRSFGSTDYIFAINDRREYGNYVGQHGLVMENGLPAGTTLCIGRQAYIYDLLEHREIASMQSDAETTVDLQLEPGGGRLLMATESAIDHITVTGPDEAVRKTVSTFIVKIVDASESPLDAVIPVEVSILDPDGRSSEYSGYYGAAQGTLTLVLDHAPNDTAGMWSIKIRELASGKSRLHFFRLSE